jgi:hypothetical protein
MKKSLAILVIAAALCVGAALNYHFVLLDSSVKILKKTELTFTDTFVDARGMNKLRLLSKPNLVDAGIRDLIQGGGVKIGK